MSFHDDRMRELRERNDAGDCGHVAAEALEYCEELHVLLARAEHLLGLGVVLPEERSAAAPDGFGAEVLATIRALGFDPHKPETRLADLVTSAVDDAMACNHNLRQVLAVVHGDGGHYTEKNGVAKSVEVAMAKVFAMHAQVSSTSESLLELTSSILEVSAESRAYYQQLAHTDWRWVAACAEHVPDGLLALTIHDRGGACVACGKNVTTGFYRGETKAGAETAR